METQEVVQNETPYEPTAEQTQRAARLRRFNFLFVYAPIGLVAAVVVALVVIMLITAINPPGDDALLLMSGLADVTMIIALLPCLIVGAALVGVAGFALSRAGRSGSAPIKKTQTLLWRLDALIERLRLRTITATGVVAKPFLAVNGAVAYFEMLITQLVRMVKRS